MRAVSSLHCCPSVEYGIQGIFVGYRGFEIRDIAPLFPFGHGLSYSQFEYSSIEITPISLDGHFTVTFNVKNVGKVNGREITQIYVADRESSLPRPIKELKGFVKASLKAGETRSLKVALDREALGFYDDRRMAWVAEAGKFDVYVASSSEDVRLTGEIELGESFSWTGL